jgi:hypothetical protein
MKPNPILEEVWRIKDELAREAGNDIHRLCENTRRWAAAHPRSGPVVQSAQELRRVLAKEERKRAEGANLSLREEPPREDR